MSAKNKQTQATQTWRKLRREHVAIEKVATVDAFGVVVAILVVKVVVVLRTNN